MNLPLIPIKRLISITCSFVTSFSFQFCEPQLEDCFFLENDQITRSYQLDDFNQITSHLPGEYTIKQADYHRVEVSGHQRYIDSLSLHVINKKVHLGNKSPFCQEHTNFDVTIYMTDLQNLFINEKSNIVIENFEKQTDLSVSLTKKSFLEINRFKGLRNLYAELSREAIVSSTSKLDTLDQIDISIAGEERFSGFPAPAKNVAVNIEGKGYCEVYAVEKLNVVIKGNANVYAKGMPSLYKRITGKGNVYFND
ncbi:DUF2807 domain-containing protein [Flavobacteriaceae bacterium]|nr:DUF2807 domain-containing protein [Flavobacteriaceae bacterium]MDB4112721.1 DUF2807 domain-containing protein [Flavobacteriaceae bacterium]MDB4186970.1 DUF2807 domain-containing protein [Flavobacteriaceae bacterium]MDB9886597.1 DUF2807 domain-containing protein [Flavobacteriaceae bacterium]